MTAFQQRPELYSGAGRTTLRPQDGKATGGAIVVGRALATVIVTVHGRIDLMAAAALTAVLHDLIDGQGNLSIVVDLRDVPWIDGAGLHVLASAAKRIEARGGELRLGGPSGALTEALSFAGLGRLVSTPFEQAHRPWPRARSTAGAVRRASIDAHAAGTGRHHDTDRRPGRRWGPKGPHAGPAGLRLSVDFRAGLRLPQPRDYWITQSFEVVKPPGPLARFVTGLTLGVRDRRADLEDNLRFSLASFQRLAEK